jgi:hypothetical protein
MLTVHTFIWKVLGLKLNCSLTTVTEVLCNLRKFLQLLEYCVEISCGYFHVIMNLLFMIRFPYHSLCCLIETMLK